MTGTVYLLHFDRPYRHARHYLGWASAGHLESRIAAHRSGRGARLMAVIKAAGIGFDLARTWPGSRTRERQIKRQGGASRCCPACGVRPRAVASACQVSLSNLTVDLTGQKAGTCQHKPCAICEGPWQGRPVSAAEVRTWPEPPF